jgi:hypothetical protein
MTAIFGQSGEDQKLILSSHDSDSSTSSSAKISPSLFMDVNNRFTDESFKSEKWSASNFLAPKCPPISFSHPRDSPSSPFAHNAKSECFLTQVERRWDFNPPVAAEGCDNSNDRGGVHADISKSCARLKIILSPSTFGCNCGRERLY